MSARKHRKTAHQDGRPGARRPGRKCMARLGQGCLLAAFFLAVGSGLLASPAQEIRFFQVKAAIDSELEGEEMAEVRVARWLCGASSVFNKAFGFRFHIQQFASWSPPSGRRSLPCLMNEFLDEVDAEGADIVIGLISPDRTDTRSPGIASYAHGALLLRDLGSEHLMTLLLVHELGHVFGAVDLNSSGSIMSTKEIRLNFDPFTSRVVSIHRCRAFGTAARLLPDRDLYEALMSYRERAALDLGEVELALLLARFYLEWDARKHLLSGELSSAMSYATVDCVAEAVRQCERALAYRPECAAAQHLLGVALERGGYPERAKACYKRAMDLNSGSAFRH